jgi:hypothetical protein
MIHARFFKGRANAWLLTLESNGVAVDPASIDKVELKWPAKGARPAGSVDSVTHPAAFTRETNGWRISLGALDLSVGSYIMTILAYGPAFPQGMNFTPKDLASIEILPG